MIVVGAQCSRDHVFYQRCPDCLAPRITLAQAPESGGSSRPSLHFDGIPNARAGWQQVAREAEEAVRRLGGESGG